MHKMQSPSTELGSRDQKIAKLTTTNVEPDGPMVTMMLYSGTLHPNLCLLNQSHYFQLNHQQMRKQLVGLKVNLTFINMTFRVVEHGH